MKRTILGGGGAETDCNLFNKISIKIDSSVHVVRLQFVEIFGLN